MVYILSTLAVPPGFSGVGIRRTLRYWVLSSIGTILFVSGTASGISGGREPEVPYDAGYVRSSELYSVLQVPHRVFQGGDYLRYPVVFSACDNCYSGYFNDTKSSIVDALSIIEFFVIFAVDTLVAPEYCESWVVDTLGTSWGTEYFE